LEKDLSGEWLTQANWTSTGTFPGSLIDTTNSDTALSLPPGSARILGSILNNNLTLGTISVTSGPAPSGALVASEHFCSMVQPCGRPANVILSVTGGSTLTLDRLSRRNWSDVIALGNSTNNVVNVETGSTLAINVAVARSARQKQLTLVAADRWPWADRKLICAHNVNLNAGTLLLGGAEKIANGTAINLNGGTLNTGGFSETAGSLTLSSNSTINLGAGASTLTLTNLATYTTGQLTITGLGRHCKGWRHPRPYLFHQ
jgi:hypothetical protein